MRRELQHEIVKDASLTFAHILKTELPKQLEKKPPVEVVFEIPDIKVVEKHRQAGKILIAIVWIGIGRSTMQQRTEEPIVREEDANGDIVEYKLGPPTFLMPSYLFVPFSAEPLQDQVLIGTIMRTFLARSSFLQEDIQGSSISATDSPMITAVESFNMEKQMTLWRSWGQPYRPGVVYGVSLRVDSLNKTLVRRVKERVLDFKKLEG